MRARCAKFVFGVVMAVCLAGCKRSPGPARLAEPARVAKACLQMIRSSLTNEVAMVPDDPRLPDVIRSLRPHDVSIAGETVVVTFPLQNGLIEYHFMPVTGSTNTWELFGAGPRFNNEHKELFRIRRE